MRNYYYARMWNAGEEVIEALETSHESQLEFEARMQRRWPQFTIAVDSLTLREFLFLGRKFEDSHEVAECERNARS